MASSSSKTKSSGLVLHSLSPSTRFCSYTTSKTSFSSHAIPSLCNSILHPQFSFWSQPRWNSESKSSTRILSNLCTSFLLFSHGSCYLPASRASQGLRFVRFSVWCNQRHLVRTHNTLLRTSIPFRFRFFFIAINNSLSWMVMWCSMLAFSNRAFCYSQLELHKHVIKDCDKALQLDPSRLQAYILKGLLLVKFIQFLMNLFNFLYPGKCDLSSFKNNRGGYWLMNKKLRTVLELGIYILMDLSFIRSVYGLLSSRDSFV